MQRRVENDKAGLPRNYTNALNHDMHSLCRKMRKLSLSMLPALLHRVSAGRSDQSLWGDFIRLANEQRLRRSDLRRDDSPGKHPPATAPRFNNPSCRDDLISSHYLLVRLLPMRKAESCDGLVKKTLIRLERNPARKIGLSKK